MAAYRPVAWLLALLLLAAVTAQADEKCERLKASLTYAQKDAPRDLSDVVRSSLPVPHLLLAVLTTVLFTNLPLRCLIH